LKYISLITYLSVWRGDGKGFQTTKDSEFVLSLKHFEWKTAVLPIVLIAGQKSLPTLQLLIQCEHLMVES
jgi:hypothetical protein